jgi:DNA-binding MurR/RpiR family transcriptional regulator
VTDSPISPVGQLADVILLAVSAGTGMQNSMVAPMAVANALLMGWQPAGERVRLSVTAAMTV